MPRTGRPATRQVVSVSRALTVLGALADGGGELGTNDLARRTGINASSVSRLLATLAEAGMVEHLSGSGRYRLGIRLVQLGNAALERLDLRDVARPQLQKLAAETDETATLSIPDEQSAVTVDFVRSPSSVQSVAQIGRPSVAHATATGKVMLAFSGFPLPSEPLTAYTERTIVDVAVLAADVDRVRRNGWAQTLGEREENLNAIAAPVWDSKRMLAAILGLQGPAPRFNARAMRAALEPLRQRAEAVSSGLGWRPG